MSRGAYYDVFMDRGGNVLAGATVAFTGAAGGTVYSAGSGGTAYAGGTVLAGFDGSVNVYPDADRYTVTVTLPGFTTLTKVIDVSVPAASTASSAGLAAEIVRASAAEAAAQATADAAIPATQKGAASGVAPLNASSRVPVANLASGTPDGTKFVRDDGTLATPSGGSSTASGVNKPGVFVPKGSLDRWKAARDTPATFADVPVFGDSTTQDNGATYSWVYRLRSLALAAGVGDGGRGIFDNTDTAARSAEGLSGIVTAGRVGFAGSGGSYDFFLTNTFKSSAANDTITFQGKGTRCRLHYAYQQLCGDFSYAVDGGAPVTVGGYNSAGLTAIKPLVIDLGTEGTHTVTVTNLGGTVPPTPSIFTVALSAGGTLANTTRYVYAVTAVNASGETIASSQVAATTDTRHTAVVQINRVIGAVSYNVYRATLPSGNATNAQLQYMGNISGGGSYTGILNGFTDDGSITPTATNPPTVSTAGRAGPVEVRLSPEFYRPAGVVFQKHGVSGIGMNSYFSLPIVDPSNNNWAAATALGITSNFPPSYSDTLHASGNAQGSKPTYRQPALAILHLGINTVAGVTDETSAVAAMVTLTNGVEEFKRLCDSAGCDALVIVPHLEYALNSVTYAGRARQAIYTTAVAVGCAVVDFNIPLGAYNTGRTTWNSGPHLNDAGYTAQAAFLWDNALSATAYP